MKIIYPALILFGFFLGAVAHENDMARNCARDGAAGAWFHEIACEVKP